MLFVPLPPIAGGVFSQRTRLGERDYVFRYRHNSRTDSWSLDIETIGEAGATEPIMTGKKLFPGHDLLRRCYADTRPPGRLFVLNYDPQDQVPGANNLGRFRLVYLDEGETLGSG
jgi:hypothetical protein